MNHPRKSNLDVKGLQEVMAEAAKADGVPLRKPALPTFNAPTAHNVATVQRGPTPAVSQSAESPSVPRESSSAVLSTSKVETQVISAEFEAELDLIDPLPTNSRFDYTDEEVDDLLGKLIREGKQLEPMRLTPHDTTPGRFYALDGFTRKLALTKWGKKTGRAVLVEVKDPWERYKASWYANNGARHTTDYDNGMRWRDMIDRAIVTQPGISVALGEKFSEANVSRILSIAKLPETARNFIRDHKFKLSANFYYEAFHLYKGLTGDDREERVMAALQSALNEDLSAREFSARIGKQLQQKDPNGAAPADNTRVPQSNPLLFAGREVGEIKEWTVGEKLRIDLKKIPVELRDQVKEAVRKVLENAEQKPGISAAS